MLMHFDKDISKNELDGPKLLSAYNFGDKTGQRKPKHKVLAQLSPAVTQGAEVWVIQALQEVGNGTW